MTFTYNLDSDLGRVRLLISDRDEAEPHYTDAEIQAFLDFEEGDVHLAAAAALESWAALLSTTARDLQLGEYREMTHHAAREMRLTAERYRQAANSNAAFAFAEPAWGGLNSFEGRTAALNKILRGEV